MHTIAYFGHHKCATTYITGVLRTVAQALGWRMHVEFLSTRLPLGYEHEPEQATRIVQAYQAIASRPYDLLCHGNADSAVVQTLAQRGPFRGFHVIRDPRDLIVSGYFWHQSDRAIGAEIANRWNVERRDRLRAAHNKEQGLLLELEFSASYLAALCEWDYQQPNICEMKYEEMILDPLAFFVRAFTFVGLSITAEGAPWLWVMALNRRLAQWRRCPLRRFAALPQALLQLILQEAAFERQANGQAQGEGATGHKYRKGVSGDWRNHFTPAVTAAFKARYGALLIQLGYEENMEW